MRTPVSLFALIACVVAPLLSQSVEGVWKPVEVVVDSGPDQGRHTTDVQPGLVIFTKRHYSVMFVRGFKPRPIPSDGATDEQLGLSFLPFTANSGTYQKTDSTITFSPTVAKHPAVMAGTSITFVVRVRGDTLWTTLIGSRGFRSTWVRIERP